MIKITKAYGKENIFYVIPKQNNDVFHVMQEIEISGRICEANYYPFQIEVEAESRKEAEELMLYKLMSGEVDIITDGIFDSSKPPGPNQRLKI